MGKYTIRTTAPPERPWTIHPIWRGIGCLMILIIPPVAFAGASLLIDYIIQQHLYPIPFELASSFKIPQTNITLPHFYASLLLGVVLLLIGFALVMILYSAVYYAVGPKRYGPQDAEPIRRKTRPSR
jgi:hypothetical protein